jgi:predicted transcriptional regulator
MTAAGVSELFDNCYLSIMTTLLDQAVKSLRDLPAETQDALARLLLQFAGLDQAAVELSAEDATSFDESLAQAERGEFATDEQMRAIWAKHGL